MGRTNSNTILIGPESIFPECGKICGGVINDSDVLYSERCCVVFRDWSGRVVGGSNLGGQRFAGTAMLMTKAHERGSSFEI
jgi:hypothetical protein